MVQTGNQQRSSACRARATLLSACALFVLGQFAAGLAMDRAPLKVRFPDAANMLAAARALPRPPDVVLLGSSRFGACIDAHDVTSELCEAATERESLAFNASVAAGDSIAMEFCFDQLLGRGLRPQLVLIEISPETIARRNPWIDAHIARQFTWADLPEAVPDILRARRHSKLLRSRLIPVHYFRREFRAWLSEIFSPPTPLATPEPITGDQPAPTAPIPDVDTALLSAPPPVGVMPGDASAAGAERVRKWLRDYEIGGIAMDRLERLLARCESMRCRVLLVAPPVHSRHRANYTPEIESMFLAAMGDLTSRHGCRFIDERSALPDDLFRDNHHATAAGAREFSRALGAKIAAGAP